MKKIFKKNKECVIGARCDEVNYHVTNIFIDVYNSVAIVTIEQGMSVSRVNITLEEAEDIGFINVKALSRYI